jgi:FMN phosphatase YigB (HAD superfamily)
MAVYMKTILVDTVHAFVIKGVGVYKPMYDLLETYKNRKILLSNVDDVQIDLFGLHNLPYELFTLKHTPDKVDPVYYQNMLAHFHLKKDECVYFEHDEKAVCSAQSIGIMTYYYDSNMKDLVALKKFLDSNVL